MRHLLGALLVATAALLTSGEAWSATKRYAAPVHALPDAPGLVAARRYRASAEADSLYGSYGKTQALQATSAPGYCAALKMPPNSCENDSIAFVGSFRRSADVLQLRIRFGGQPCPNCRSGPHYVAAWIDWNGNHTWEDSELAYWAAPFFGSFSGSNSPRACAGDTVMTPTVQIPKYAVGDSAWMRVGVFYFPSQIHPCAELGGAGNTVDHKIILRAAAVVRVDAEGRVSAIQDAPNPIWEAALASGTCTPVVGTNRPFAGGFSGSGPTLKVTLETCSGPTDFTPHVSYRWRVLDPFSAVPDTGSNTFDGWHGRIQLNLPHHVQKTQTQLTFDIEDGDHNVIRTGQTITLDTYVGLDVASAMPELATGGLHQLWLDRATTWANGAATPLDLAHQLQLGAFAHGATLYRDFDDPVPWSDLVSMGGGSSACNCVTMSNLWTATARMLGLPSATIDRTRGARGIGFVTKPGAASTFDADQHGNCGPEPTLSPDRWFFGMHQVGVLPLSGSPRYFDPTFGLEYEQFPDGIILWNLLPDFRFHAGRLATPTDGGNLVFAVEDIGGAFPWGFYNFTPVPVPPLVLSAVTTAGSGSIDGPGSWTAEDPNGDDAFDDLRWDGSVTFTNPSGSSFAVLGALTADTTIVSDRESDSSVMPTSGTLLVQASGTHPITLRFSGEEIRSASASGSLVGRFWLTDSAGTVLDTLSSATPSLSSTQFGEKPVRVGALSDRALDLDGSGHADDIEVDTPLIVTRATEVRVVSRATDPRDTTLIAQVDTIFTASPGSQTVRLALPGTDFVLFSVDGPFDLRTEVQALGYPPEVSASTSQGYLVSDFDGAALSPLLSNGFRTVIDSDHDGQVDELLWQLPVSCLRAGAYRTVGRLADQNGVPIVASVGVDTLAVGNDGFIHLVFSGDAIAASGLDPYYVIDVRTVTDRGVVCLDGNGFFINGIVDHNLFSPFVRLGSTFSSAGVDKSADGLLDSLNVTCKVTNVRADTARVFVDAALRSSDRSHIASGRGEAVVAPQATATVVVHFDGRAISAAGVDGPFRIDQMSVSSGEDTMRAFSRLAYLDHAHTTGPFDYTKFAAAPHVFGLVEYNGVLVPDASVRMEAGGQPAVPDSSGRYHLSTPDFQAGTYTVSLSLPAGSDTSGWRTLKNGQEYSTGQSAVVTFGSTEAIRLDFVHGTAVSVDPQVAPGTLLTVRALSANPARFGSTVRFAYTLARAATMEVAAFDLHGRQVLGPLVASRSAGAGTLTLPLQRGRLPAGVYQIRIRAEAMDGVSRSWVGRQVILN